MDKLSSKKRNLYVVSGHVLLVVVMVGVVLMASISYLVVKHGLLEGISGADLYRILVLNLGLYLFTGLAFWCDNDILRNRTANATNLSSDRQEDSTRFIRMIRLVSVTLAVSLYFVLTGFLLLSDEMTENYPPYYLLRISGFGFVIFVLTCVRVKLRTMIAVSDTLPIQADHEQYSS